MNVTAIFEAGFWVLGFVLFFGITWIVGRHHSEKSAMRRILKRRGYDDAQPFEEQNDAGSLFRVENQAYRQLGNRFEPETESHSIPNKLPRAS